MSGVTFAVDVVDGEPETLELISRAEAFAKLSKTPVLATGGAEQVFLPGDTHPLVGAVHAAFAQHCPLVLTPDAMWMTIAQGFAIHVRLHADELRERFVRFEGKQTLEVTHPKSEIASDAWPGLIAAFTEKIREHVGPGIHKMLVCDFSTTGIVERTASEVAMMDAFQRYFDYVVRCICGIPTVTLLGTVEDWKTIRRKVDVIAEYGLAKWADVLRPICDELVKSAEGKADKDFWQCLYKPRETYGGEIVTGWISRLFPYFEAIDGTFHQNDFAPWVPQPKKIFGIIPGKTPPRSAWLNAGIPPKMFPAGLSTAPVKLLHEDGRPATYVEVLGGFIGASQDAKTKAIKPELGWGVRQDAVGELFAKLAASAKILPTPAPTDDERNRHEAVPGELLRFWDRFGGAVSLFDGAWQMRSQAKIESLKGPEKQYVHAVRFADLAGGRGLAFHFGRGDVFSIFVCKDGQIVDPPNHPIVARGIFDLLRAAIAKGPLFFDDKAFQPSGTLDDLIYKPKN